MIKNADESPMIVAQTGPFNGQRWVIQDKILIGREDDCDIVIPNRQVSRHHARFSMTENGVVLEDLSSKNGTHYNGQPLNQPILLRDGDIVQIALAQQFVYLSSDATLPLDLDLDFAASMTNPANTRLRLEKRSRRVWVMNKEISPPLSVSQFSLLEVLYHQNGQVVPRSEVINAVWGEDYSIGVSDQALDALVRRLRDRLAEFDANHSYINTIRGHGLRLENPPI